MLDDTVGKSMELFECNDCIGAVRRCLVLLGLESSKRRDTAVCIMQNVELYDSETTTCGGKGVLVRELIKSRFCAASSDTVPIFYAEFNKPTTTLCVNPLRTFAILMLD